MPSTLLGNPLASGAQIIVSGNVFSGRVGVVGGVQLRLSNQASGNAYIGLSGAITRTSGGFYLSGTLGLLDGVELGPGDSYFIPKIAFQISGTINVYAQADATCSGQSRLFWEVY